jgi:hypothetical protein
MTRLSAVPPQRGTKGHRLGHFELRDVNRGKPPGVDLVELYWHPGDGSRAMLVFTVVPERVPLLRDAVAGYLGTDGCE